ncbi:MAG: ppiD [Burkholderiaceae bacterium]|nr:ppiD [Burkholderiaceae bacterium]
MFDFVRTHQRWLQVVLLLLILPAFVLTGVATFNSGSGSADTVAQVGTRQITQREFAARYQKMVEAARAQAGENFDASMFQKPETQAAFLTQLVNEALIEDMMATGKMTATDNEVAQALAKMQGMPKNAQGEIDVPAYQAILAQQGLTQAQHQQGVRADLVKGQLAPAYSALSLPVSTEFMKRFFANARTVEIKPVDLTPYMAKADVNATQVQAYYEQNKTQFATPDLFDVEYTLVPMTGAGAVSVTDDDIKSVFGKDATAAQLDKVRKDPTQMKVVIEKVVMKKRAAEIDAQVNKSPQDLAAVAKAFNTSVQKVARLTRNVEANTPTLFKDTKVREAILNGTQAESKAIAPVMALDSGELLVARVSAYQAAGTRSFDEVKAEIEQQLRREAAVKLASDEAQKALGGLSASASIGAAQSVSWLVNDKVSQAVALKAMSLPAKNFPALAVVSDKDSVSLIRVLNEQPLPAAQMDLVSQWAQSNWVGAADNLAFNAYMSALRERMGAKMYPERIKLTAQ